MAWWIAGRKSAGSFETEGAALAAAWELTLPGGVRPEVYKVAKMTVTAREGSVRIAPADAVEVEAGQVLMPDGSWVDIGWVDENGLHVEE